MALALVYAVLQFVFMWWLSAYNMEVASPAAGSPIAAGSVAVAESVADPSGSSSIASDAAAAIAEAIVPSAAPGPAAASQV